MPTLIRCACVLLVLGAAAVASAQEHAVDEVRGTWRGTSTCTDRAAMPACQDETVVYEVRNGDKAGTAVLAADKIVNGERVPMGEMTFVYDAALGCWRSDFESPRLKSRWCFTVDRNTMSGTARLLPGNELVRRIAVTRVN